MCYVLGSGVQAIVPFRCRLLFADLNTNIFQLHGHDAQLLSADAPCSRGHTIFSKRNSYSSMLEGPHFAIKPAAPGGPLECHLRVGLMKTSTWRSLRVGLGYILAVASVLCSSQKFCDLVAWMREQYLEASRFLAWPSHPCPEPKAQARFHKEHVPVSRHVVAFTPSLQLQSRHLTRKDQRSYEVLDPRAFLRWSGVVQRV